MWLAFGAIAVGGGVIIAVMIWSMGIGPTLIGLIVSLIPVPIIGLGLIWLDRFDPASWRYLGFAFGWGACVATSVSLGVNTLGAWLIQRVDGPLWVVAVVVAPVIEETTKGLAPLLIFWFRRRELSSATDAIVFAGLAALGFAMTENVLYLGGVYLAGSEFLGPAGGTLWLVMLFGARIVLSGFAHPMFTVMTALGLVIAVRSASSAVRQVAPVVGLTVAMLLHAGWNGMATASAQDPRILGYGYLIGALPILAVLIGLVLWLRTEPGRIVARVLPEYVQMGWFSPPEIVALATPRRRLWARRWAYRVAGPEGKRMMRIYQIAATRLALLRDRMMRGVIGLPHHEYEAEERWLLHVIDRHRAVFTGRDMTVPPARWDGTGYLIQFPDGARHRLPAPPTPVVPVPVPLVALAPPRLPFHSPLAPYYR